MSSNRVAMWEAPLTIPTYRLLEAETNPIFYTGRIYQGAKGPVYPYPFLDRLTTDRHDKVYRAIYLENPYVQLTMLPELGGRVFAGLDKTNNYDFIYRQHVIKPSLIGLLGAWISGGAEWDLPHHHRATTYMPVDYHLVENLDGSKTLWVGETEWRHRMRWTVGITLFPDRSYFQTTITLRNRTPLLNSFLCFTNMAVAVNDDYQVLFPPSTEYGVQHAKCEFIHWPIGREVYAGHDYNGVDVSWWKNHTNGLSIFAWNDQDDFFGGYDHGKQAGIVHVADRHTVPGKKFFEFGSGAAGRAWDKILTDTDGPYLELMAGAYSDNQPDYSWIQPYEVKTVQQYWYPIRNLGGLKHANVDAALNLDVLDNKLIKLALNTTAEFRDATVLLRAGDRTLLQDRTTISPNRPYRNDLPLPTGTDPINLRLSLLTASGKELIAYQPAKPKDSPRPAVVVPPPQPKDIATNEELYLAGLRLEQFHSPAAEPDPYYEEALKRDPGDSHANTALGVRLYRRGLFPEAQQKFEAALARITRNYTRARNGEAHYYLGLTLLAQNQISLAVDAFNRAAWDFAWRGASYYELAQLSVIQGNLPLALHYIQQSIAHNSLNNQAHCLRAMILRHLGRLDEAQTAILPVTNSDPLDFRARHESILIHQSALRTDAARAEESKLLDLMRDEAQSHLELASDYARCHQWDEASAILIRFLQRKPATVDPMVHYTLAYYQQQAGHAGAAVDHYRLGNQMSPTRCFPFRLESIDILRSAIAHNPSDARAHYYLGNLLYELQPEQAITAWERSRDLDSSFATVHRNLALAYTRQRHDRKQALASLQKACQCDPNDAKFHCELDVIMESLSIAPSERLAHLNIHHQAVLNRDDALLREITLYVIVGQYDCALDLLDSHHFHIWEGAESAVHDIFVDAHILRGRDHFEAGRYTDALADFQAALEYPDRFEVGRPDNGGRDPEPLYLAARTCEALSQPNQAKTLYTQAVEHDRPGSYLAYYQALAWRKLGREDKASSLLTTLTETAQKIIQRTTSTDFFEKFGARESEQHQLAQAHYLLALALLGQSKPHDASKELAQTLELNPNHTAAKALLSARAIRE